MNIYLLTQQQNTGYDTYDSLVVCAENEQEAAMIHPIGGDDAWDCSSFGGWASSPENVTVKHIGAAHPDVKRGLVLASFNAG